MINSENLIEDIVNESISGISFETIKAMIRKQVIWSYEPSSSFDVEEVGMIYVISSARRFRKMTGNSLEYIREDVNFENINIFITQAIFYHACKTLRALSLFDPTPFELGKFDAEAHIKKAQYQVGDTLKLTLNMECPETTQLVKVLKVDTHELIAIAINKEGPYDARIEDELKFTIYEEFLLGLSK